MAKKKVTKAEPKSKRASARLTKKEKPVYVAEDGSEGEAGDDSEVEATEAPTEEDAEVEYVPQYKDDKPNAFNTPVHPDKDFISTMPPEVLDNILSYCVLDHDPELAVKKEKTSYIHHHHVLISLAAMSTQLRDCVESFSLRQLTCDTKRTLFKTTAEREAARSERWKPKRRSKRIAAKPQIDTRVYRKEFLAYLQFHCYKCNTWTYNTAVMCNGVACCKSCERKDGADLIFLTDALKQYDLRDYMLVPTRKPGPRAKHTNLPVIPYGTKKSGTAMGVGHCVSYRFYRKDVRRIAQLVHGDFAARMAAKRKERLIRKRKKVRQNKRELKIKRYSYLAAEYPDFEKRLQQYKNLDVDGDYDSDAISNFSPDERMDNHAKLCKKLDCERCEHEKVNWGKYGMEHMYELMYDDYYW
ncbi:hypothetical protein LTR97_004367 [Elasticomyces elasticus]|uniref:Uncharacterized protein n=1 Tax=Elasticomyces elasticus TaxID=574655 RepID=A0AAN7W7B4_9PEZI|nr:hypothetical protein LTR97_004367 [Elasticomyces elasticus]